MRRQMVTTMYNILNNLASNMAVSKPLNGTHLCFQHILPNRIIIIFPSRDKSTTSLFLPGWHNILRISHRHVILAMFLAVLVSQVMSYY